MTQVCIRGIGAYTPAQRRTNQDIAAQLNLTEEYIVKLTGIHERRWAPPEEATSDMAAGAAQSALDDAGVAPEDIDGLLTLLSD